MEGPAAKTVDRLVAARAGKILWLVKVFGRWEARSAAEATMEPSATMSRNQGAEIPDEGAGFYQAEEWGREGYPIGR
jgi:hypothetical protein